MEPIDPLDPLSKELLDAARGGHVPPPGGRARVRTRVIASLGTSVFASGTAAATAVWVKIGVIVAAMSIGGGAVYFAIHREPSLAPSALAPVAVTSVPATPAVTREDPPSTPAATEIAPPAPKPSATAHRAVQPEPAPAASSIAEETTLLLDAQSALRDGDSSRALALLDEHARRFPNGALGEEREAARVLALCTAGRTDEGLAARQAFLAAHPRSPAASRVRSSCGGQ